jgi:hypothetical protein
MLVYDYALGGHTVHDMRSQVLSDFLDQFPNGSSPPWTEGNSLFGMSLAFQSSNSWKAD